MIAQLSDRALFKLSGDDAQTFLQGQLSNDINALVEGVAQLNAYCQHQGKIIALLWVMKKEADFYLSLPKDLADVVRQRLQMFVMMSEVSLQDVSAEVIQLGVIDENIHSAFTLNTRQSVVLHSANETLPKLCAAEVWEQTCIETGVAEVYLNTSEKFIPQMLNLDIDEVGVNFSKGCYPGQEVVARLHYLGKTKRRLMRFEGAREMQVGEALIVSNSPSARASGMVVRTTKSAEKSTNKFACLATIEVAHQKDEILLEKDNAPVRVVV